MILLHVETSVTGSMPYTIEKTKGLQKRPCLCSHIHLYCIVFTTSVTYKKYLIYICIIRTVFLLNFFFKCYILNIYFLVLSFLVSLVLHSFIDFFFFGDLTTKKFKLKSLFSSEGRV